MFWVPNGNSVTLMCRALNGEAQVWSGQLAWIHKWNYWQNQEKDLWSSSYSPDLVFLIKLPFSYTSPLRNRTNVGRKMYENFQPQKLLRHRFATDVTKVSVIWTEQWRMQSCSTAAPVQNCLSTAQEPSCPPLIHKLFSTRTTISYFNKTGNIVQKT